MNHVQVNQLDPDLSKSLLLTLCDNTKAFTVLVVYLDSAKTEPYASVDVLVAVFYAIPASTNAYCAAMKFIVASSATATARADDIAE